MSLIFRGGWIMVPLGICSLVVLTVVVERLLSLVLLRRRTREFLREIDVCLRDGNVEKAEALCRGVDLPIARVLEAGFRRAGETPEAVADALRDAAAVEIPAFQVRLGLLATLAQVSTLLGLLGTVLGMIRMYQMLELRAQMGQPATPGDMAGGIWEALVTTAAGLFVAIPAHLAACGLAGLADSVISDMERRARRVLECLAGRRAAEPGRRRGLGAVKAREETP